MLNLVNLNERVRQLMLEEVERDLERGNLYVSPRLSNTGTQNYVTVLKEAIRSHDDDWLAQQLSGRGRVQPAEPRRRRQGGFSLVKVPYTAARTIAREEFNRYYIRAVCRLALEEGVPEVVAYRARRARQPRPESEAMVGRRLNAQELLDDLRANTGGGTALGLPPGPGSGLSVRLPEPAEATAEHPEAAAPTRLRPA
jgi:hypothetical protein